jgi:hypothetical protein
MTQWMPYLWEQDGPGAKVSFSWRHFGQYHGAGVFTGLGLRLWHRAQR